MGFYNTNRSIAIKAQNLKLFGLEFRAWSVCKFLIAIQCMALFDFLSSICGQYYDISRPMGCVISWLHVVYCVWCLRFLGLESKQPIDELKSYGRLGPENVMFNYSGCAGIIIVEADRHGVSSICMTLVLVELFLAITEVCNSVLLYVTSRCNDELMLMFWFVISFCLYLLHFLFIY